MTNEEAIKKLKNILVEVSENDDSICYVTSDDADALKAAIQALEQQPCENYIDKEALIEELKLGYFNKELQEGKNDPCVIDAMIDWAIRTVKRQSPATPQPFINKPCVSEGVCREDKMQVLDKIRAELIQSIQNGVIKIESGNEKLFHIIDKYKTESENEQNAGI